MDLTALKANGPNLTASQQAAFYYARKRRRARENSGAAEFNSHQKEVVGVKMAVIIQAQ